MPHNANTTHAQQNGPNKWYTQRNTQ